MTPMRPSCGRQSGMKKHIAAREPACDACLAWQRDKVRRWRRMASTRCVRGLGWPERSP
jgi:hypothetical protein